MYILILTLTCTKLKEHNIQVYFKTFVFTLFNIISEHMKCGS